MSRLKHEASVPTGKLAGVPIIYMHVQPGVSCTNGSAYDIRCMIHELFHNEYLNFLLMVYRLRKKY